MFTLRLRTIAAAAATAIALASFNAAPARAYDRNGDAVAAAVIAGVLGTAAAVVAAKSMRDRNRAYYGPHYATPYPRHMYRGAPVYRGHNHGPQWRGWHRHHWHR